MTDPCDKKLPVIPRDIHAGLVLHDPDCALSLVVLSDKPVEGVEGVFDWTTNTVMPVYPALIYGRDTNGSTTGLFSLPGSTYHIADPQRAGFGNRS